MHHSRIGCTRGKMERLTPSFVSGGPFRKNESPDSLETPWIGFDFPWIACDFIWLFLDLPLVFVGIGMNIPSIFVVIAMGVF